MEKDNILFNKIYKYKSNPKIIKINLPEKIKISNKIDTNKNNISKDLRINNNLIKPTLNIKKAKNRNSKTNNTIKDLDLNITDEKIEKSKIICIKKISYHKIKPTETRNILSSFEIYKLKKNINFNKNKIENNLNNNHTNNYSLNHTNDKIHNFKFSTIENNLSIFESKKEKSKFFI